MNVYEPTPPPVQATIDSADRLIAADPRLLDLTARAGGAIGAPLAVPQLATLVRLARRLGIVVSRAVTVADGEDDVDLWVRIVPDGNDIRLALTGWRYRLGWTPPSEQPARAEDFAATRDGWEWETDAALRLTQVSAALLARTDRDAGGLLGAPITRLFTLHERADGSAMLAAIAEQAGFEAQPANLRDTPVTVLLTATPRRDQEGRFAGFIGSATPVEPPAAAPADTLPPGFGSHLDRALRQPLGRIVANADSIAAQREGPLDTPYADYAGDIAAAGRHLIGLVDDLVDLQFVERPGFTVAREAIDLGDVARRAAGLLAVRAEAQDVRIDRPPADDPMPATGEFRRALQIMVNLIGNAVRYSPPGGMVWLRLERDGAMAAVIVADQGKGIAADDQARIFEKFERVDASEPGGSGLGLYIARRLARAMGGDIVVDSAPGQGARFVLTLPAA